MIARTVTVEARITDRIIRAQAVFTDRLIEAQARLSTQVRHYHSDYDDYDGEYTVTPDWESQILSTNNKVMHADVTVEGIYINSAQNPQGGNTVYIGGEIING